MHNVSFFFVDDSTYRTAAGPVSSLTGLVVPTPAYDALRQAIYVAAQEEPREGATRVFGAVSELHFHQFLEDRNDDAKLAVITKLVDLVCEHRLTIIRVGYVLTKESEELSALDPKLIGACWFGLVGIALSGIPDVFFIPVMDAGFEKSFQKVVTSMSSSVTSASIMRAVGFEHIVSIPHTELMSEVLYGDDHYSALLQLTDVVAGLRRTLETIRQSNQPPSSEYKRRLAEQAERLDHLCLYEKTITMTVLKSTGKKEEGGARTD